MIEYNIEEFKQITREGISELMVNVHAKETGDLLKYFDYDHHTRYLDGWNLIAKHLNPTEGLQVLEAGSPFPFFTYAFASKFDWIVKSFSIEIDKNYVFSKAKCFVTYGNLCLDDLGKEQYDFIITTEVLEHLLCSLPRVIKRILRSLKPNGYWLVSFPMGGMNACDYNKDLISYDEQFYPESYNWGAPHRREFTEQTIRDVINDSYNLKLLDAVDSHPIAYFYIKQHLYQKVV